MTAEERITRLAMDLDDFKSDLVFAPENADPQRALELAKELEELPALLAEYQDARYRAQQARRLGCRRGGAINLQAAEPSQDAAGE